MLVWPKLILLLSCLCLTGCNGEWIADQLARLPEQTSAASEQKLNVIKPSASAGPSASASTAPVMSANPSTEPVVALPTPTPSLSASPSQGDSADNQQIGTIIEGNNCPGNDNDCSSSETTINHVSNVIQVSPLPAEPTSPSPSASASASSPGPTPSPEPTQEPEPELATGALGPITVAAFSQSGQVHEIVRDGAYVGIVAPDNASNLWFYRSENSGQNFTALDLHIRGHSWDQMALGKDASGAWILVYTGTDSRLWMIRSTNHGSTWGAPVKIASSFVASWMGSPHFVTAQDNTWLVFQAYRQNLTEIYLTHFNASYNFTEPVRVTTDTVVNDRPKIAVTANGVHVAWHDNDNRHLMLSSSHDSGDSFGPAVQVDDNLRNVESSYGFGSYGNKLYLAYWRYTELGEGRYSFDVLLARSWDDGQTFTQLPINNLPDSQQEYPTLAVDAQGVLHVFWSDSRSSASRTMAYASSRNNGQSFESRLLDLPGEYRNPHMALDPADPEHVYLSTTYENQNNGTREIHFFRFVP